MLSSYAYWETKEFLEDLGETYQISVNGELRDDKAKILSLLHNMDNSPFLAHHSHPTKRIKIEIESGRGLLELVFRRDSERPQEYWVFYPKYEHTQEEEIARVTTSIFEDY